MSTPGTGTITLTAADSPWKRAWRRLCARRGAMVALAFLVFIGVACACGPWLLPHDYATQDRLLGPVPPGAGHWLGTDVLGRDVLARVLQGGRISLQTGFAATLVAVFIGVAYGVVAGWRGGRTGALMVQGVDVLSVLPFTLFVILLTVLLGQELIWIYAAIGAVSWLTMARIVRNETRVLKTRPFVEAAVCLGQSPGRIVVRHLLPNLAGTIVIYATLTVPSVMLTEAFISFLGLGVKAPMTSWGLLIKEGADVMEEFPWLLLFPGGVFSGTLLALNVLGDGLRDASDPRETR
jgi:oligopeptide transport system permease protein